MRRFTFFLVAAFLVMLVGCNVLTECEKLQQHEAILLIDVSDKTLFEDIKADLNANLPTFMEKSGLGQIGACQSFTLTMVPISAKDGLEASSETISIVRKGQSYQTEKNQASPAPLVQLMKKKLAEFEAMTNDEVITSGSNIANVLVKALSNTNIEAETTVIVFSDMVENNQYLNMYRTIPEKELIPEVAQQLIDPLVRNKFQSLQREGLDANIIIVCKESANTEQREVRNFWGQFLSELKLRNVQFMDNLTNIN